MNKACPCLLLEHQKIVQALVAIPMQFGLSSERFSWVTWPRDGGNRAQELTHAQEKYSELVSRQPAYKWPQLLQMCTEAALGTGAHLLHLQYSSARFAMCV